jgi:hypothetical protein
LECSAFKGSSLLSNNPPLIHPRGGKYSEKTFDEIQRLHQPLKIEFKRITLIEQCSYDPWRDLIDDRHKIDGVPT